MKEDNNDKGFLNNERILDELADKVINRLIQKNQQHKMHQYNKPKTIDELIKGQLPFKESDEEFLISEMTRLTTLLNMYEHNEEDMKAAIIKRKLEIIQDKLNKL